MFPSYKVDVSIRPPRPATILVHSVGLVNIYVRGAKKCILFLKIHFDKKQKPPIEQTRRLFDIGQSFKVWNGQVAIVKVDCLPIDKGRSEPEQNNLTERAIHANRDLDQSFCYSSY